MVPWVFCLDSQIALSLLCPNKSHGGKIPGQYISLLFNHSAIVEAFKMIRYCGTYDLMNVLSIFHFKIKADFKFFRHCNQVTIFIQLWKFKMQS